MLAIRKPQFIITSMVPRFLAGAILTALRNYPVVALLGPRQVGKTTLALAVARQLPQPTVHLDLERDSDLNRLEHAELYFDQQAHKLVIIDEVQRRPNLFPLLRSVVDERIRHGERVGHFLVLGSASRDLLQQSSESLAGRIAYLELRPFSLVELADYEAAFDLDRLWVRGGFPNSYLAATDQLSADWRGNFISTYLERDIPQLGPRLPAVQMRRLWTMLAHGQGAQLNAARLAASLGVSGHTVRHYLDVLTDLYMVRQLPPWSRNPRKRLVKTPKLYVRDSGLVHRLANIPDLETLLGHPLCGDSWEGFAIESLLMHLPDGWEATYYRTSAQAEIDLVLEGPGGRVTAIEVKRTLTPVVSKGFRFGCDDIGAAAGSRFYCIPDGERYPIGHDTDAIALRDLVSLLMTQ
jgi:predicted AAA+ superfamily ATPase